jgi:hypothetical protein
MGQSGVFLVEMFRAEPVGDLRQRGMDASMPLGILADFLFAIAGFPLCGVNDARGRARLRHATFFEFLAAAAGARVVTADFGPLARRIDFQ